ncbi:MAG: type II and III secretion system protein [Armatimonadetes bacterium]|nr:type II and III secretion system protein [Armatimonadota bacterium]
MEIIELTGSDAQQLGTIFGVPTGGTTGGGGGGGGTSDQGGTIVSANNGQLTVYGEPTVGAGITRLDPLAVSIRALINNNRARVLQKPYISSNDSQQGSVELVTDVPLPSTTQTAGGGASQSVEFRPVGIRLLVTPRINWAEPSDQIEMTIETEVSAVDFGISVNIGGSVIPGVTNRNAVTVVTVDDGETFVIGGLTSETERKNVSRIPFISEIPLIGELFKYTDSRKEQATVVVVMTPRITW